MSDQLPKHVISRRGDNARRSMPAVHPAESVAANVGLPADRLIELAESGYAPHWTIDGGPPLFNITETKQWVRDNLAVPCIGRPLAVRVSVAQHAAAHPKDHQIPQELLLIEGLCVFPCPAAKIGPVVYFLCRDGKIVYVGSSVEGAVRIPDHVKNKEFDAVFYLSVPLSQIREVERDFAVAIRPEYNVGANGQLVW